MCVRVCTCVRVHNRDCNTSTGILYYFDDDDENDAIRAPSAKKSVRITVVELNKILCGVPTYSKI